MNGVSAGTEQIIAAFRDNGMTPEQIAESFDNEYDVVSIKAVLMQFCPEYRKLLKKEPAKAAFTDEQEEDALRVIAGVAAGEIGEPDDTLTRLRAAIYIRDDKQGRKDAISKLPNMGLNIVQLQMMISKANAALQLTDKQREEVIDVPGTKAA